ncbi:hypothetical protein QTP70_032318, partial [Hemibagrus guttatus]
MLAYKAKNGPAPSYLKALVTPRTAPRSLRSTSTARLVPPSLREKVLSTTDSPPKLPSFASCEMNPNLTPVTSIISENSNVASGIVLGSLPQGQIRHCCDSSSRSRAFWGNIDFQPPQSGGEELCGSDVSGWFTDRFQTHPVVDEKRKTQQEIRKHGDDSDKALK